MSSEERRSTLTLLDDGRGQINCPLKGVMAIQRCREWQRETTEAGKSCTCSVYQSYARGEPDVRVGSPIESDERCGRAISDDFDEARESLVRLRNFTSSLPRKSSLNAKGSRARRANQGRKEMGPTRPKYAACCSRCGKTGTPQERVWKGMCKKCRVITRIEERRAAVANALAGAEKRSAAAIPEGAKLVPPLALAAAPSKQKVIPVVAEQEIADLREELTKRDRIIEHQKKKLGRVQWLIDGVKKGYSSLEVLLSAAEE